MFPLLASIVIGLFVAMLFVNIYFRVKVLKSYKVLVQNEVEFEAMHVFSDRKLQTEVIPKYPHLATEIMTFANHLRYSIKMATVLLVLITLFGGLLMQYGR
ncbi:MAG: hypothetical protein AAGJ93_03015 [Bacteroidota bacterium]